MDSQTVSSAIAEMKGVPTFEELEKKLNLGIYIVKFTKLDGTERTMKCTRSYDIIPKETITSLKNKESQSTLTVWDIDINQWRSFRYDRIISVEKSL